MIKNLITLNDTVELMKSSDYQDRFVAEFIQTLIRYERLKAFNTKIQAAKDTLGAECEVEMPEHDCPDELLLEQQRIMGNLLHIYEKRAVIEDIDLADVIAYLAYAKKKKAPSCATENNFSLKKCPIKVGDKVHYIEKDEDNVVTFHPYIVRGIALVDGKWFALDSEMELNEVDTEWCVVGYNGPEVV